MKAVMLAAGIGARLRSSQEPSAPKVLLEFEGRSLLQRHIEILERHGIEELVLGVGFNREEIEKEIVALGAEDFVTTVVNPNYEEGSVVTLWALRDALCWGGPVLLMDGDVLYDNRILARLATSAHQNCVLLDRSVKLDDEAVKLCIRDREIVEFRKWLSTGFDFCGESVGFFRLSASVAEILVAQTELYLEQGRRHDPYEEPLRDVLLTTQRSTFGFEDISGLPWIEIDTAADLARAKSEILPRILAAGSVDRAPKGVVTEVGRGTEFG